MRAFRSSRHAPKLREVTIDRLDAVRPRQGRVRATRGASLSAPGKWDETICHHTHSPPPKANRLHHRNPEPGSPGLLDTRTRSLLTRGCKGWRMTKALSARTGPSGCGWGRGRTGDLPLFRRTLVPTELPSHEVPVKNETSAVLTGFEPAASTLTGWRALQTAPQDLAVVRDMRRTVSHTVPRAPNGIRTRATALKGRRPGPLDDEGVLTICRFIRALKRGVGSM